ncbi:hypothetical protein ACLIYM_19065 [Streptomyces fenghuangensis]|uniref:DUF4232 domain-containing protein n=1 Tax=Streptomyces chitinivorans TaxID=1257027 RepID=A0ABW7HW20_9ACTN|nr:MULTISPECIES: hypothetical protein [Streptomyces]MCG3039256.1 hypothetical protein [Streptomyces sp. ICN903]MDH2411237.1 hypothetical protein [Streptomyces chitinivorans]
MRRLALLPILLAAGCALPGESRACTLIGAESGVRVVWEPADFAADAAGGGATVRLCVRNDCTEREATARDPFGGLSVRLEEDAGPATVPVRFTVTASGGRTLLDDRTEVALRRSTPNGEECPPVVWQAALRAVPGEGLVPYGPLPRGT